MPSLSRHLRKYWKLYSTNSIGTLLKKNKPPAWIWKLKIYKIDCWASRPRNGVRNRALWDQGSLGCSSGMGMTLPSVLRIFLVDFSVLPSHRLLLLTTRAGVLNFSFLQQQHSEPSLVLFFFFFPSLASANMILILEIAGPSWVPTYSTVSCLPIFWECGCPPPWAVRRENVSLFCLILDVNIYPNLTTLPAFPLCYTKETCWGWLCEVVISW